MTTTEQSTPDRDMIENACEVMHVAYERAAIGAGWETNPLSRTINWAEVPEANKATMRAAVAAVLPLLRAQIADEIDPPLPDESTVQAVAQAIRDHVVVGGRWSPSTWKDYRGEALAALAAARVARRGTDA